MFPRPLSQYFHFKKRLFCQNQHIFVERLPIDFFYFEDFRWSIFGKIIGQKQRLPCARRKRMKKRSIEILDKFLTLANERINTHLTRSIEILDKFLTLANERINSHLAR